MTEIRPSIVSLCGANRCGNSISFDALVDIMICCCIRDGINGGVGKAEKEEDDGQGQGGPAPDNLRGKVKAIQKFSLLVPRI